MGDKKVHPQAFRLGITQFWHYAPHAHFTKFFIFLYFWISHVFYNRRIYLGDWRVVEDSPRGLIIFLDYLARRARIFRRNRFFFRFTRRKRLLVSNPFFQFRPFGGIPRVVGYYYLVMAASRRGYGSYRAVVRSFGWYRRGLGLRFQNRGRVRAIHNSFAKPPEYRKPWLFLVAPKRRRGVTKLAANVMTVTNTRWRSKKKRVGVGPGRKKYRRRRSAVTGSSRGVSQEGSVLRRRRAKLRKSYRGFQRRDIYWLTGFWHYQRDFDKIRKHKKKRKPREKGWGRKFRGVCVTSPILQDFGRFWGRYVCRRGLFNVLRNKMTIRSRYLSYYCWQVRLLRLLGILGRALSLLAGRRVVVYGNNVFARRMLRSPRLIRVQRRRRKQSKRKKRRRGSRRCGALLLRVGRALRGDLRSFRIVHGFYDMAMVLVLVGFCRQSYALRQWLHYFFEPLRKHDLNVTQARVLAFVASGLRNLIGFVGLLRGFRIEVRGKINGSTRTRRRVYGGPVARQTLDFISHYGQYAVRTYTGVFSFRIWLF